MSTVDRFRAAEGANLERIIEEIRGAADDLRADNDAAERKEVRERLQVLEGWKVGAGTVEVAYIDDLIWLYRDALGI